ncbi:MAG: glycoside hydrolase family 3 C-terminal domain-containing protein [Clostridia bacterium]|nr:glycoside hydrolase family 3 C-terminal domain-containing protein [Clostridia bacterium]
MDREKQIYRDRCAGTSERVEDLLSRMTLEEKIAQLSGVSNEKKLYKAAEGDIPCEGFGAFFARKLTSEQIGSIMRYSREKTRLGIPPVVFEESLHGLYREGSTVFPQSIGMGASFDPELVYETARVIGAEARASGIRQTLAPNIDISREPRWGRVEENYGEDPYLTSRMAVAYVTGLQSNGVAATVKHYAAHGSPEGGINISPVHTGEREWRESMIEPFAKAVQEAGVLSVMPAYSELDGIPLHAHRGMVTDVLRGELGFEGYVISDFGAIPMLVSSQHVARDCLEAGKLALHAGLDMEATSDDCMGPELLEAARRGEVSMDEIDGAVRRVLTVKFRLGLFDEDDDYFIPFEKRSSTSLKLSRKAAEESAVLLKNNGILPLREDFKKILLVGPNADTAQLGDYSHRDWERQTVTLKQALRERYGDRILYAKGCAVASPADDTATVFELAREADCIIAVMGENSMMHGGIGWGDIDTTNAVTCGEGFDTSTLLLPDAQREFIGKLSETGKPLVLVLENGRPLCIGGECSISDAVIEAWYPGEQGGYALADILFGKVNPSGRLPISFPRSAGHVPCFYNHKVSARGFYKRPGSPEKPGMDYIFDTPAPLFPFGYGLSYTRFEYADLTVRCSGPDDIEVSVDVRNAGSVPGAEAVLMFISQHICPVTPFVKRLRKFTRVELQPKETAHVTFKLEKDDISYIGFDMKPAVGEGRFTVTVADLSAEFEL